MEIESWEYVLANLKFINPYTPPILRTTYSDDKKPPLNHRYIIVIHVEIIHDPESTEDVAGM